MDVLAWIEQTRLSAFVREDFYAYFVLLVGHAWGMAFLVGGGIAVSLRTLGFAPGIPLERMSALFPVMKIGALLAIVSGIGLLAGYPAKALTNWIFPLKFACLIGAAWLTWLIARDYFPIAAYGDRVPPRSRWLAGATLLLWLGGVASGKLLLYTNTMLLTTD
jgi:hypothetical protein